MSAGIFVLQENGELVEMTEQPYDSEAMLQELLANHPSLLVGDQVDPTSPRRWLLIAREAAVMAEADGAARWAMDHLFLDQDAVPTLVEVKRSTDTRIRREVVGQMLDYAANAVVYWPVEFVRTRFEQTCQAAGIDPEQAVAALIGMDQDPDSFWQAVKTNLQAGRIRLVFVADQIPPELQRVVEFLNTQMDPAEVLAVEVRQYAGASLKTLVPRVLGQTAGAQQKHGTGGRTVHQWDEASFLATVQEKRGAAEAETARRLIEWARQQQLRLWWGKGKQVGSCFPMLDHQGTKHWLFAIWTDGNVQLQFQMMQNRPHFQDEAKRLHLLEQLNAIPGIALPSSAIGRYPSFKLSVLTEAGVLAQFLEVFRAVIEEIRAN